MTDEKVKHGFLYYLNPFVWIRMVLSYIMTFVLILNHFFVFILGSIILILTILFFYDRYALLTYDGSAVSDYSDGFFSKAEKYNSPLARGDKYLMQELSEFYASEKKQSQIQKTAETYEPLDDVSDIPPIWDRRDDVSSSFISREVRRRVREIEKSVLTH